MNKRIVSTLLIFLWISTFFVSNLQVPVSAQGLAGWKYYKTHDIQGSTSDLTDYQMEIVVWKDKPTNFENMTFKWTNETVMLEETPAAWDADGMEISDIIKIGSTYLMYYCAHDGGGDWEIGIATSSSIDGPWTKYGSNPVLSGTGDTGCSGV